MTTRFVVVVIGLAVICLAALGLMAMENSRVITLSYIEHGYSLTTLQGSSSPQWTKR